MEVLLTIGLIVVFYLVYLWIKFSNFRSQLMNELGQRGLNFEQANTLYSLWAKEISNMHHDGMHTSRIADVIIDNVDFQESDLALPRNQIGAEVYSYEEWHEKFVKECTRLDATKARFLEFLEDEPLKLAFRDGQVAEDIAEQWVKTFDPLQAIRRR